jgi:hypothetical protein
MDCLRRTGPSTRVPRPPPAARGSRTGAGRCVHRDSYNGGRGPCESGTRRADRGQFAKFAKSRGKFAKSRPADHGQRIAGKGRIDHRPRVTGDRSRVTGHRSGDTFQGQQGTDRGGRINGIAGQGRAGQGQRKAPPGGAGRGGAGRIAGADRGGYVTRVNVDPPSIVLTKRNRKGASLVGAGRITQPARAAA